MAEKRTIELEIQDNSKSLKSQYKAAVAELQKVTAQYGETSKEAVKAAKAAAELKDQITFSKDLVDSFNPDAKFNSLTKSVSGVLDGFQAYEGAMGLIGAENEELQKTMLKVQSAMALSQGIQGVFEAKDAFKQLGTVVKSTAVGQAVLTAATAAYTFVTGAATTGLKLFRAALVSTGIGALVVGVGLLVANFDKVINLFTPLIQGFKDFGDWIGITSFKQDEENKKAVKRADNRIAEINREKAVREKAQKAKENAYNAEDKALGRQIDLMRAQGKDTTALERARLKATINYQANLQNETFAIFNQNKEKNKLILSELRAIAVREKDFTEYNKFLLSTSATQNELAAENAAANEARKDAINQLAIFETEVAKRNAESQSNYNQQSIKSEEKTAETKIDIARRLEDETLRIREEGRQKELDALDIKYKRQKEDAEKELENDKDKVNKLAKLNSQAIESRKADEKIINDKYDKIEKDAAAKALEDKIKLQDEQWYALQKLKNSQQEQDLLDLQIAYDKEFELAGTNAELQKALTDKFNKDSAAINKKYRTEEEIAKAEADKKEADRIIALNDLRFKAAKETLEVISNVTELFAGKSKAQQKKAFQIQKAVNIAGATMDTYKAAASALKDSPAPFNYIAMAAVITAGLLNVKKIASQKFEGGGSSGGGGGTGGGGAAPITPQFNTVGNSGINQLAQLQQQPVQAYVVSGEVTSQQALDRNRAQNSSL